MDDPAGQKTPRPLVHGAAMRNDEDGFPAETQAPRLRWADQEKIAAPRAGARRRERRAPAGLRLRRREDAGTLVPVGRRAGADHGLPISSRFFAVGG